MNKTQYYFGIFCAGLWAVILLFQSMIRFQIGTLTFKLPSLLAWTFLAELVYIATALVLLRYYYHKKYSLPFFTEIPVLIASVVQHVVFYNIVTKRVWLDLYFPSYYFVLGGGILSGLSLLFSKAAKRPWLKLMGIFLVFHGLTLLCLTAWLLKTQDLHVKMLLERTHEWAVWIGIIGPAMLIMNYLSELKVLPRQTENSLSGQLWHYFTALAGVLTLISVLFLIERINREAKFVNAPLPVTQKARELSWLFQARTYVSSRGDTMRYRLMKPLQYDPQKKYPLVVCLHHGGAHGVDNINSVEGSDAPFLSKYTNRQRYPAFLFVPQCPQGSTWAAPDVGLAVFEMISALEQEFAIDVKRRYVMGTSGGGYGSWHFIGTHPKMFAAAIPRCGAGETANAKNMVDVAVWAFHGAQDDLVPVSGSREMIAAIKKEGGHPRYTEYPYGNHYIWEQIEKIPDLLDWLFEQKRK